MDQMSADKRTVSTDALETLGTIIGPNEKRDAIHLAVEPTIARKRLRPGQHVGVDGTSKDPVGIVDPFLSRPVMPGEKFWLVVFPRKINSLRHVWTHPAFPDTPDVSPVSEEDLRKAKAMAVIEAEADQLGLSYEDLIDGAHSFIKFGDYMIDGGRWEGMGLNNAESFWSAYEIVTGETVPENDRHSFFSCSC
jgi:hypothetical protein